MEQTILMAMQTCREFARKSYVTELTEYEMLMYEAICNLIAMYTRCHEVALRPSLLEAQRVAMLAEEEHEKWLKTRNTEEVT